MSEFRKRILEPLSIAVAAVAFIGGLVWGLSRFLLVTDKDSAVALAFVVSFGILVVAAFMANGRFGTPHKVALVVLGLGIAAGGNIAVAMIGIREFHGHVKPADLVLVAKGLAWDRKDIVLPAAPKELNVEVDNQDAGTPHNFALYRDEQFAQAVFKGPVFPGVAARANLFENPGPGKYYFQCDVHPGSMRGTATVAAGSSGGSGGSGGTAPPAGHGMLLIPALLRRRLPRD